ncbi:MAG: DUF1499 domain-containing protein [Candidatus Sericytochromatia bacterium]
MAPKVGMIQDQFQPLSKTPNCRSSMADPQNSTYYVAPLTYSGSRDSARSKLMDVLKALPLTHLIKAEEQYLYYQCRTKVFKFTDDVEFYFPAEEGVIHMRSASRIGYNDWGTNLRRLEGIRAAFERA